MTIKIEVKSCADCPYYKTNRYGYCSKAYSSDVDAYKNGDHVEYLPDMKWLFENCPLKGSEL